MKSYLECYPCFLKQAVEASRIATNNEVIHHEILREVIKTLLLFQASETPALMGKRIHAIVREFSNNPDPYSDVKKSYNRKAHDLLIELDSKLKCSADPFLTTLKFVAMANIIDFGPFGLNQVDLADFFALNCESKFHGNVDPLDLKMAIEKANSILYVADNCGEVVFDAYFVNNCLSSKRVFFSLRGHNVLNDATRNDIGDIYLGDHVKVIDNGDDAPGILLENCSLDFLEKYHQVDLVLLKGQGNFEGIGIPVRDNVYSILVAKCPVVSRHLGCSVNDLVLTVPF